MTARPVRRIVAGLALLLSGAVVLSACGGTTRDSSAGARNADNTTASANPNAELKKDLKITFLPKQVNNPYFTTAQHGGEQAAQAFGWQFKATGPSDASAASQVTYINTAAQQRQDALVLAANDVNAVAPALRTARSQGMKVVTFDSDAATDARDVFVNQASTQDIAVGQVKLLSEQLGGQGEFAILSATPNATNQNAWIEVMKTELAKPEYAGLKLVETAYGNDDDQTSFQKTQGLLQAHPNLRGIISPTTVGLAAAARYLSSSEYKGKVALTGLGTPNQLRKFVQDGTVTSFALWDPNKLGYLATYAAAALASGQITGASGEKFTAGEMGEYTVGEHGEVVLGPPTVFTRDNIDQFDF
ncbi:rhamnose ABC transporter substrate-binding protein [Goodfellowiella coeruleoviolacea]|uniref:Rhamnose transport system substrate-binding protein n=1 Tax=Goodfellowiella coeruleoviolacea TaxID=334858 RepID=A0AAE3GB98_9PSEU|nr:rhamnose ABC transporter substrate-binding protein [Goodfellowiella coeruleoviolacea]MCP2164214.1 rhamnose transport system substrate-binding protein [Goodfellowiella coeruleoviolacea]